MGHRSGGYSGVGMGHRSEHTGERAWGTGRGIQGSRHGAQVGGGTKVQAWGTGWGAQGSRHRAQVRGTHGAGMANMQWCSWCVSEAAHTNTYDLNMNMTLMDAPQQRRRDLVSHVCMLSLHSA